MYVNKNKTHLIEKKGHLECSPLVMSQRELFTTTLCRSDRFFKEAWWCGKYSLLEFKATDTKTSMT